MSKLVNVPIFMGSFASLKGSGLRPKGSLALRAQGEFKFPFY